MKQMRVPLSFQIQALGPFLGARSSDSLQNPPIESSVRFNLTYLVAKEGSFFRNAYNSQETTKRKMLYPLFFQIQALGPFLEARSRDLLQIPPIESSVRFNLTDLVTKEGCKLA